MTHSRFLKKAAMKLDRLSLSKNYPEYIRTLESVRDCCSESIDNYYSKIAKNLIKKTDNMIVKKE